MTRNYTSNDFYCMKCGNKGIPISRPKSLKREKMHRKKLYCCTCREEVNHIECKNSFEAEENTEVLEDMVELRALQKDEFTDILEQMENAMYSLDGDLLLKLLDGMKNCQYEGKSLNDVVKKAVKKVEMSDYMSAVEMLAKQMSVQTSEE